MIELLLLVGGLFVVAQAKAKSAPPRLLAVDSTTLIAHFPVQLAAVGAAPPQIPPSSDPSNSRDAERVGALAGASAGVAACAATGVAAWAAPLCGSAGAWLGKTVADLGGPSCDWSDPECRRKVQAALKSMAEQQQGMFLQVGLHPNGGY